MRETASAPPASAARAISAISVTFGVSFMITGCFAIFLISAVSSSTCFVLILARWRWTPPHCGGVHGLGARIKTKHVEELTAEIKKIAKQPVIMKLTPNVTDIAEITRAAEAGGADAVSLINTLTGMKIDVNRRTFALANKTGGVSGPAVHPIAVRMVYQLPMP